MTAINTGGESAPSNAMYFVVRASSSVLPAAPTGLTATWVNGHVSLGWADMSTNETGFKIERRDGSGTYGQIATTGQNTNFYTDTVAATTIDHCYRVRATNGAGDSAYSNESCLAHLGSATATQHIQFSSAAYMSAAAEALSYVTITRTGGSTGTVGVTVLVSQGTATAGVAGSFGGDYFSFGPVAVLFAPGQTSQTVKVLKVLLQRADDCTVNVALTAPTGDATLGSPSAAVMTIQGTGLAPGTILIQDPVCSAQVAIPLNPCGGDGLLSSGFPDPTKLAQLVSVHGAVADGVTLLVLSVPSSTPVKFSLSRPSPQYGALMQVDGSGSDSSVTVTPTSSRAYALYLVPIDSPWKDGELPVGVSAVNSTGRPIANGTVYLRHPSVVLVHGIWSSPSGSFGHFRWGDLLRLTRLVVEDADYSAHFADTFNPYLASEPIDALVSAVKLALGKERGQGIAASQVDVVAHSMGGVVARAKENDHGPRILFHRNENRKYGEFHKLITIGTPHRGSEFADYLAKWKCWPVGRLVSASQRPINQAVYDLQTSSWTLYWLGSTVVPSHSIAGIEPAYPMSMTESQWNIL